ncbi:MAG TPA: flagellar assembly protein A [Clostridium sp.]
MDYNYSGKNLEECLEQAEKDLSISRNQINYDILKEEKGFLKKKCEITIHILDTNAKEVIKEEEHITQTEEKEVTIEENCIVIHIDEPLELEFAKEIKVFVNDEEGNNLQKVTLKDNIKFECENIKGIRDLYIAIDNNRMEVKVSLHYVPETIISISCRKIAGRVKLVQKSRLGELPPFYTKDEIRLALKEKGVVFGFLEDVFDRISKEREVIDEIIAKGILVINDEDDRVDIKFENTKRNIKEDSNERIDYRNIYSIANVRKDEVLAELISGKTGSDGINVFGMEIKKKNKKILKIQAKEGCVIDGNKVIATAEGRPTVKNGIFYVNKVFEAGHDVDMKSGNISFIGDVKIAGSVKDGMLVEAGNGIDIGGNVENAKIIAQGEVHIKGNCINANILVGAKDFSVQLYLNELMELKEKLEELMNFYEDINKRNLLGADRSVGEIIKVLLETKFKDIQKKSIMILVNSEATMENGSKLKRILRAKLLGSGPLGIKYSSELYELIKCIDIETKPLDSKLMIPVDAYLNYCQETTVKATGDIFITGKGQYISNLSANGNIDFESSGAIARGGILSAGKDIKAKTVGSVAGVTTLLKVPKNGVITADIAYQNSVFVFGERQYLLEITSKNIRAYINEKGEIVVGKFVL